MYTLRAARLGQHQPVSACFEGMAFRCGRSLQGRLQALSAPFVPLLVGCLGGRLWAEVLWAMFMSACGRLWALLRGACGRMWATRTEVLQACIMSACGRLWAALLPLWAFLLAGASRRMWGLFLGAFGCAAHMGARPRSLLGALVGACGRGFIGCLWGGGRHCCRRSLHNCLRALVGALGGRLWVVAGVLHEACGRLWAAVLRCCGRPQRSIWALTLLGFKPSFHGGLNMFTSL